MHVIQMDVAEASVKIRQLLAAMDAGEGILTARDGARLGLLEGVVDPATIPDFTEAMSDDKLAEWGA